MKTFKIGVGVRSNTAQTSMICYALLRTAGVTMSEFMKHAEHVDGLMGARMTKPGNILQFECTVFDDISVADAKKQVMQLVLIQLACSDISLGEFETSVLKHFKPVEEAK